MSEERKYWVPALEKADRVLSMIAQEPDQYKLIDLANRLSINKSSMFSLLLTMGAPSSGLRKAAGTPMHSVRLLRSWVIDCPEI